MTSEDAGERERLMREAADAERAYVDEEARAERRFRRAQERLAAAEDQLARAARRAARRREQFAKAEAELRQRQASRATGPALHDVKPDDSPECTRTQ